MKAPLEYRVHPKCHLFCLQNCQRQDLATSGHPFHPALCQTFLAHLRLTIRAAKNVKTVMTRRTHRHDRNLTCLACANVNAKHYANYVAMQQKSIDIAPQHVYILHRNINFRVPLPNQF
jgi:hypothetical protein